MAFFAPLDLIRNRQPILKWRGIGLLGLCQQLFDFHVQIIELLFGVAIAHSGVLAGVCQNFRAIDGNGNLPDFQEPTLCSPFQNLGKRSPEQRAVISPECANGVMVGMRIRTHKAHGHIGVGGALDLPAGKHPAAIGINQERQKHGWRILLTAGSPMIDLSHGCIHRLDGINHEMDEMVVWDPVSHVRRKQHGCIAVDVDEFCHIKLRSKN